MMQIAVIHAYNNMYNNIIAVHSFNKTRQENRLYVNIMRVSETINDEIVMYYIYTMTATGI